MRGRERVAELGTEGIREPLAAVSGAITRYAIQLVALAGADESHAAAVKSALAPIDAFREAAASRRKKVALPPNAPKADAPVPAVPAG